MAMSEFEALSLDVARKTYEVYFWGDVIAATALLAAIVGGIVAVLTLRTIIRQLDSAKWNALLSFESDMAARRERFQGIARDLSQVAPGHDASALRSRFAEAQESYLNAVERLASSILNGQFPPEEMKQSYRDYIASTIREFPDSFRPGTGYRKILKLHDQWQD